MEHLQPTVHHRWFYFASCSPPLPSPFSLPYLLHNPCDSWFYILQRFRADPSYLTIPADPCYHASWVFRIMCIGSLLFWICLCRYLRLYDAHDYSALSCFSPTTMSVESAIPVSFLRFLVAGCFFFHFKHFDPSIPSTILTKLTYWLIYFHPGKLWCKQTEPGKGDCHFWF